MFRKNGGWAFRVDAGFHAESGKRRQLLRQGFGTSWAPPAVDSVDSAREGIPGYGVLVFGYAPPQVASVVVETSDGTTARLPVLRRDNETFYVVPVPETVTVSTVTFLADDDSIVAVTDAPSFPRGLGGGIDFVLTPRPQQVTETAQSDNEQDAGPASTSLLTPQPCDAVTFTFPARTDAIELDVRTATLDDTRSGVFLTSALTIQRGGAIPDVSERPATASEVEIVSTAAGDVTVHPAQTRAAGPVAYGTLPASDTDVNDLADGTSSCDVWTLAAQDPSVSFTDLVALLEELEVTS